MQIVGLYAAMLSAFYVLLSVRTLRLRRSLRIPIGDSGNSAMLRAMRVHSNFAEHVPLALVLILLVESGNAPPALIHGFFVGRVA
jgi:uncharacterized protein